MKKNQQFDEETGHYVFLFELVCVWHFKLLIVFNP